MSINYYRHHIGDYSKNTQQLTLMQHGAYRLLMDYYYTHEGPIPNDLPLIYRVCRCANRHERSAVLYVLSKYFLPIDGVWKHKRVDEEIKKYNEISEERKKAGAIAHANRGVLQTIASSHKPIANSHKLASGNGHAKEEEIWEEETLPSAWHTYAEQKGIPDEQIYASWRKFKEKSSMPWQFRRWRGWVDMERAK